VAYRKRFGLYAKQCQTTSRAGDIVSNDNDPRETRIGSSRAMTDDGSVIEKQRRSESVRRIIGERLIETAAD